MGIFDRFRFSSSSGIDRAEYIDPEQIGPEVSDHVRPDSTVDMTSDDEEDDDIMRELREHNGDEEDPYISDDYNDDLLNEAIARANLLRLRRRRRCIAFLVTGIVVGCTLVFTIPTLGVLLHRQKMNSANNPQSTTTADSLQTQQQQHAPWNLPNICAPSVITQRSGWDKCMDVCRVSSCCHEGDDLREESCFKDYPQLCTEFYPCSILHEGGEWPTLATHTPPPKNDSSLIEGGSGGGSDKVFIEPPPSDLGDWCHESNEKTGLVECMKGCEGGVCCWSPNPDTNCYDDNVQLCRDYDSCQIVNGNKSTLFNPLYGPPSGAGAGPGGGEEGGGGGPPTEGEKAALIESCTDPEFKSPGSLTECKKVCSKSSCCFDYGGDHECFDDWCKDYHLCKPLYYTVGDGNNDGGNDTGGGTAAGAGGGVGGPPTEGEKAALIESCTDSKFKSTDELTECKKLCDRSSCCFDYGGKNECFDDWCKDYHLCKPLYYTTTTTTTSNTGGGGGGGDIGGNDTGGGTTAAGAGGGGQKEEGGPPNESEKAALIESCTDSKFKPPDSLTECKSLCARASCCFDYGSDHECFDDWCTDYHLCKPLYYSSSSSSSSSSSASTSSSAPGTNNMAPGVLESDIATACHSGSDEYDERECTELCSPAKCCHLPSDDEFACVTQKWCGRYEECSLIFTTDNMDNNVGGETTTTTTVTEGVVEHDIANACLQPDERHQLECKDLCAPSKCCHLPISDEFTCYGESWCTRYEDCASVFIDDNSSTNGDLNVPASGGAGDGKTTLVDTVCTVEYGTSPTEEESTRNRKECQQLCTSKLCCFTESPQQQLSDERCDDCHEYQVCHGLIKGWVQSGELVIDEQEHGTLRPVLPVAQVCDNDVIRRSDEKEEICRTKCLSMACCFVEGKDLQVEDHCGADCDEYETTCHGLLKEWESDGKVVFEEGMFQPIDGSTTTTSSSTGGGGQHNVDGGGSGGDGGVGPGALEHDIAKACLGDAITLECQDLCAPSKCCHLDSTNEFTCLGEAWCQRYTDCASVFSNNDDNGNGNGSGSGGGDGDGDLHSKQSLVDTVCASENINEDGYEKECLQLCTSRLCCFTESPDEELSDPHCGFGDCPKYQICHGLIKGWVQSGDIVMDEKEHGKLRPVVTPVVVSGGGEISDVKPGEKEVGTIVPGKEMGTIEPGKEMGTIKPGKEMGDIVPVTEKTQPSPQDEDDTEYISAGDAFGFGPSMEDNEGPGNNMKNHDGAGVLERDITWRCTKDGDAYDEKTCQDLCAPAKCCFLDTKDEMSCPDQAWCTRYKGCKSNFMGGEDDGVVVPVKKLPPNTSSSGSGAGGGSKGGSSGAGDLEFKPLVDKVCAKPHVETDAGLEQCARLCRKRACCFGVDSNNAEDDCTSNVDFSWCHAYEICRPLMKVIADLEKEFPGASASGTTSSAMGACESKHIQSDDGLKNCRSYCNQRACCFFDGVDSCRAQNEKWCEEFEFCRPIMQVTEDAP